MYQIRLLCTSARSIMMQLVDLSLGPVATPMADALPSRCVCLLVYTKGRPGGLRGPHCPGSSQDWYFACTAE